MGTLYENIIALCDERGIKGGRMCADVGLSKSLMTDLKMGRKTGVSAVTAQKIASYFDVSVGYLLGEEEKSTADDGLSEDIKALIDFAKTVPHEKAELVLKVMRTIVEDD